MNAVSGAMVAYVIYDHPRDFRNWFVVRRVVMEPGAVTIGPDLRLAPTLERARALIPGGMHRHERSAGDDPVIVECWL